MHIVIDKANLTFLPIKHENVHVVCDLVCLEASQAHSYVCPLDSNFLKRFTDLELMLLYKNTTGEQAMRVGNSLRNILFELATRIPERQVHVLNLNLQANRAISLPNKRFYHNHHSVLAFEKEITFKLDPVKLPKAPNESVIATTAHSAKFH